MKNKESKLKYSINAILSTINKHDNQSPLIGLTANYYLLEKLDPQHRLGKEIKEEFYLWKAHTEKLEKKGSEVKWQNSDKNFFAWLDEKEKKNTHKFTRIVYRNDEKQQRKVLISYQNGKLYRDGKICDTVNFSGKIPEFGAFVLSRDNQLFMDVHSDTSNHASLHGGEKVRCAGMIKIVNGKIEAIMNYSGHYMPGLENLYYAVTHIPTECFAKEAIIIFKKPMYPDAGKNIRMSNYAIFRLVGKGLVGMYETKKMSLDAFINFSKTELKIQPIEKKENKTNINEEVSAKLLVTEIKNDLLKIRWHQNSIKVITEVLDQISKSEKNEQSYTKTLVTMEKIKNTQFKDFFIKGNYVNRYKKTLENYDEIFLLNSCLQSIKNKSGKELEVIFNYDVGKIMVSLKIKDPILWQRQVNYWMTPSVKRLSLFAIEDIQTLPYQCSFADAIKHQILKLEIPAVEAEVEIQSYPY